MGGLASHLPALLCAFLFPSACPLLCGHSFRAHWPGEADTVFPAPAGPVCLVFETRVSRAGCWRCSGLWAGRSLRVWRNLWVCFGPHG